MSSDNNEADASRCASCGAAEADDITLKNCTACYLVKYCSIKCQKEHRPKHKRACKKRAAELRDELLFKQPESSHLGDCPICCLPLPLDPEKHIMAPCCSKLICCGCDHANHVREFDAKMKNRCPFCREYASSTVEESDKLRMKRVEANDPIALMDQGSVQCNKGDSSGAVEYWTKAAELGDAEAHFKLALSYQFGTGIEKDRGKLMYHLEEAAIGGHPYARHQLGCHQGNNTKSDADRAVKHWIIAARQGEENSMKTLMDLFKGGFISKGFLEVTLRAHHAAVDATKSPQRDVAEEFARRNVTYRSTLG